MAKKLSETIPYVFVILCIAMLVFFIGFAGEGNLIAQSSGVLASCLGIVGLAGLYSIRLRITRQITSLESDVENARKRENLSLQLVEALTGAIEARDQKGRGRAERVRNM